MTGLRPLNVILLLLGLAVLVTLIYHVGWETIYACLAGLGPWAFPIMILPSCAMYLVDACAWRATAKFPGVTIHFWTLFAVRMAGEAVNLTTPTASLGGEPVKAYLLKALRVPLAEGLTSVIVAKVTMIAAQICFMLFGLALVMPLLWNRQSFESLLLGTVVVVGMLSFTVIGVWAVRRHGIFAGLVEAIRRCGLRSAWLERREPRLRTVDDMIFGFYAREPFRCYLAARLFLVGFGFEAAEVYVMLWLLGVNVDPMAALSISALSLLVKNGSSFVPWSLGAQDGGNVLLVTLFGWSEPVGMTFALLRRIRELVWIGAGFVMLAVSRLPSRDEVSINPG